ncbi:MAG: caspase family protein [Cyclobacteriaceae bacterium]
MIANRKITAMILGALLCAFGSFAQKAEFTSEAYYVDFSVNTPSEIVITSPQDLVEKSRGFKKVVSNQLAIEGRVSDPDGIKTVMLNGQNLFLTETGSFSVTLPLVEGPNEISFIVTDNEDEVTRKVFAVETAAPVVATSTITTDGDFYALLIGVNDYQDPEIASLDKPIADAKRLGEVLEQYYTFAPENITYLENPTRSQIVDALDRLRKTIGEEDNLLLFYAGHGYWDKETETGYWIPSNGRKTSTADWFRNTTLTDQLRTIKSKHTLLIADACFSGSIFKSRSVFISDEAVAIKKLYELPSRKAMTSGTLTEVPDRSEFLKYLTKRLETNSEKYLPSAELFSSFRRAVINNSDVIPQYGTMQKVGDEGGDFIFIRKE